MTAYQVGLFIKCAYLIELGRRLTFECNEINYTSLKFSSLNIFINNHHTSNDLKRPFHETAIFFIGDPPSIGIFLAKTVRCRIVPYQPKPLRRHFNVHVMVFVCEFELFSTHGIVKTPN